MAIVYPGHVAYFQYPVAPPLDSCQPRDSSTESILTRSISTATTTTTISNSTMTSRTVPSEASATPTARRIGARFANSTSRVVATILEHGVPYTGAFIPMTTTPPAAFAITNTRQLPIIRAGYCEMSNASTIERRPSTLGVPEAARSAVEQELGDHGRSGILQPPLNRNRSQGPPPYLDMSAEEAPPRLPPEYTSAVALERQSPRL
ncbi:MAG: hypothetical protein J3Q66DRAFT_333692 [Benniella sp.]|nr:MAG: hypothetical protein J3Q66DRAFT_333692 [Benniella sp.]